MLGQVLAPAHRQIVDDHHVIAARHEGVDEMAADESGASGDEDAPSRRRHWPSSIRRSTRAGLPATTVRAGTFLVTTLPAPTIARSPISTPHRMVEPDPIDAPRRTTIGTMVQSASVCTSPSA